MGEYSCAVDKSTKLRLLDARIDEAGAPEKLDLTSWRVQAEMALRLALGDAHPQYKALQEVKYRPGGMMVHGPGIVSIHGVVDCRFAGWGSVWRLDVGGGWWMMGACV